MNTKIAIFCFVWSLVSKSSEVAYFMANAQAYRELSYSLSSDLESKSYSELLSKMQLDDDVVLQVNKKNNTALICIRDIKYIKKAVVFIEYVWDNFTKKNMNNIKIEIRVSKNKVSVIDVIYAAALANNPSLIEELKKMGADINILDQQERTPLIRATLAEQHQAVVLLLEAGANYLHRDKNEKVFIDYIRVGDPRFFQEVCNLNYNKEFAKKYRELIWNSSLRISLKPNCPEDSYQSEESFEHSSDDDDQQESPKCCCCVIS